MSRYYPSRYYTYPQAYVDPYTGRCFYDLVDEFDAVAYDYGDSAASYDHYADGGPLSPPTVCRLGCCDLSHRIAAGGLPEGATLGRSHQFAEEEGICLTHVEGGCFNQGICERLNHRIIIETCNELGYSGSDFDSGRQVIRVAAGLPPGRADDIDDEPTYREMPATQGRNDPRARQIEQRPSRPDQRGGHETSRRGPREPQYDDDVEEPRQVTRRRHDEDGYGAGPQGPRRGAIYSDEFKDPREMRGGTHLANRQPQRPRGHGHGASHTESSRHDEEMERRRRTEREQRQIAQGRLAIEGPPGLGGRHPTEDRHRSDRGPTHGSSWSGAQGNMRSMAGSSRSSGGRHGGQELVPRGYDFEGQGQRRRR
ncbi:MAG: hypothetical protein Q9198_006952 [Flavoplaca austrocitrina]